MPKLKTKKCATKRMKMSATGKVLRSQGGKAHLNGYKSRGRKRNLRGTTVTDKTVQKTMHRMQPYASGGIENVTCYKCSCVSRTPSSPP